MGIHLMFGVFLCVSVPSSLCDITNNVYNVTISEFQNSSACPAQGNSSHGVWSESKMDGVIRCELKCGGGYEPNKCNVLLKTGNGTWDREIPNCVEEPWAHGTIGKIVLSVVAGVGAVVVIHVVLCCVGFTPCGVRRGSIAACIQTPDTEAGSLFARSQRAGTKGCWCPVNVVLFFAASATAFVLLFVLMGEFCKSD